MDIFDKGLIGGDVWAPAASRIAGRPVATTAAGRAAQTIQTSRTCGRSLSSILFRSVTAFPSYSHVFQCIPVYSRTYMLDDWTSAAMLGNHIWQQLTHRPSHQKAPKNLQRKHEISLSSSYARVLQREHYDETGSGVTTVSRDGCDMQPLILRPAPNPDPPGPHTTSLNILNCHLVTGTLPRKSGKNLPLARSN